LQRLKSGQWVTVKGGSLRHSSTQSSHYRKTLRIRHFGKYRGLRRRQQPEHLGHQP
jgi:hypothetical protein